MAQSLRILNFITDDKFIDTVICNHDQVDDNVNHYYVLVLKSSDNRNVFKFKYIKNFERITLLYENEIIDFIEDNFINSIILHSLYSIPPILIPKIRKEIPILWVAWGYDLYQLPAAKPLIKIDNLYYPKTKSVINKLLKSKRGTIKHWAAKVRDFFVDIDFYQTRQIREFKNAIKRINFFSGIIELEYEMMKQNDFFNAQEMIYAYSPLEYNISMNYPTNNNILLGNSANMTNNHMDILSILKKRNIYGLDLFIPLNYGGGKEYVSVIRNFGRKIFGDNCHPLIEFLPYKEYRDLIGSCSSVIIGTMRQQAMGNIYIAIANGSKIFFFRDSILYKYFRDNGFKVFTIEDDLTYEFATKILSNSDCIHNYNRLLEVLQSRWTPNALKKIYKQLRTFIKQTSHQGPKSVKQI